MGRERGVDAGGLLRDARKEGPHAAVGFRGFSGGLEHEGLRSVVSGEIGFLCRHRGQLDGDELSCGVETFLRLREIVGCSGFHRSSPSWRTSFMNPVCSR
jgi:hypothetical protein